VFQGHVGRGVAGVRQAASAVTLVKEDDPELAGVERPPVARRAPRPGAAVHDQRWHAIGVPAGLPVHEVPVTRIQQAGLIGLDIRIPRHYRILLARRPREPDHGAQPGRRVFQRHDSAAGLDGGVDDGQLRAADQQATVRELHNLAPVVTPAPSAECGSQVDIH
jgi:hypothetical protein